jgi:hypothetical protein
VKPSFKCYGENSLTFILFQWLASVDDGSRLDALLTRLKSFGAANPPVPDLTKDPHVWLFPNFGKAQGFGEPDAVVLVDGHSFWFEVETLVGFERRLSATRSALRQLLRFRLLAEALARRSSRRAEGAPHLAYTGPTISNSGTARLAVLRKAGKPVVQALADAVERSVRAGKDHYVLLTERPPSGISKDDGLGRRHLESVIEADYAELESWCDETGHARPARPSIERFWYVYWDGDMKQALKADDLLADSGYVSIAD